MHPIRGLTFALALTLLALPSGVLAQDSMAGDWDIDTILLTGGGCQELIAHLQPLITGNLRTPSNQTDPRLTNVMGYHKYGRYLWAKTESTTAEAPAGES